MFRLEISVGGKELINIDAHVKITTIFQVRRSPNIYEKYDASIQSFITV